ncbi:MAG: ectoine/hydroxyectoine ABC transporter ATP-binding protein EhuA [Myxococcales bacterium]|jgi:polar amino acid transport system ATP-binding protein
MDDPSIPLAVRVRGLRKSYGDVVVLAGIDLDVPMGQSVAIIGPSGSGKSTLLRLLMTLERPTSGTIEIEGEYLWHEPRGTSLVPASRSHVRKVRGRVGMVFQHFNLFPHMTVLTNVTEAPRRVLGLSRKQADQQARELLERVGLVDKASAYPGQLSGGQKQRVAIARALALRPHVMLFDEVTSALDPELVGEVQAVLHDLADNTDTTMLVVTHEMSFAQEIAERTLVFDGGQIIEDDVTEVIFERPRNPRTRQFLRTVLSHR